MSPTLLLITLALAAPPGQPVEYRPAAPQRRAGGIPATAPTAARSTKGQAPKIQTVSTDALLIQDCLVYLMEDVQVPALETGALKQVLVSEGHFVKQGTLLALVDDRQPKLQKIAAELERDAALAKASDDIEVRFAEASLAFSTAEVNRLLSIERKSSGSVTLQELEKAKLGKHRDELQIEKTKLDLKVAKMTADVHQSQVDSAELGVARRQIIAPIDGEVVTVFHEAEEWVNAGEPVLQLVRMDRLRVEGFVALAELNVAEIVGREVQIEVQLARGRAETFSGKVVFVSPIVTAGGKYRVRAEVENRLENQQWLLRPGMTATMTAGK